MSLEKERLDFEREKIAERERRLIEDERRIKYVFLMHIFVITDRILE